MDKIIVTGARENNLKNVNVEIPKNKLVVFSGLSGSGKSSLAFDTIYQEGQRRFIESLSSYARQFIGGNEKPDVDSIEGLSPSIAIDQKSTSKNPRSTVGTVTEIYDYLRVLFARIGVPYCPTHHVPITSYSIEEMVNQILEIPKGEKIIILSPIVRMAKGTHKDVFATLIRDGFVRARVDKEIKEIDINLELEKNNKHDIDIVIDRLIIKDDIRSRITSSIELASKYSNGKVIVLKQDNTELMFSENFSCHICGYTIFDLEPRIFSFNSPLGACDECHGLGIKMEVSEDLMLEKEKSIRDGAIIPFRNMDKDNNLYYNSLLKVCDYYHIDTYKPFKDLSRKEQEIILFGTSEEIEFNLISSSGHKHNYKQAFEGIVNQFQRRYAETQSDFIREWIENFMIEKVCSKCGGKRLNEKVLNIFIDGKNIYDLTSMTISDLISFFKNLKLSKEQEEIAHLAIKEILDRLSFLESVGLEYLTLSRGALTLSGGEAQRIRLATQIGSQLSGVLYVLDEPSIGLHQRDNDKLINALKNMRDLGNTLIVVEHDLDTLREADYIVDVGPRAGIHGGEIVACGNLDDIMKSKNSLTGDYLAGRRKIELPKTRRSGNGKYLNIYGARENNLKNINVSIPLGNLVLVTGVSGSGKSSLINEVLYKNLYKEMYKVKKITAGRCDSVVGYDSLERIIKVDQSPIGRTPRSNPATYTGVFDDIRDLFSKTNEAKAMGFDKGRFSFNVKGGRCEHCSGDGVKRISMQFLPDVYVKCDVCHGKRYNKETLNVLYKGKNISDVLNMTISEAYEFFDSIPKIKHRLETLCDVGLGYLHLGESSLNLSGGEAQRVKLATELCSKISDKNLYILDEPTTGLHQEDIKNLMNVINRIVDKGATVIIIEHNLDVIKLADYIIDLGPLGGNGGGTILYQGPLEGIINCKESYTGKYLEPYLKGEK